MREIELKVGYFKLRALQYKIFSDNSWRKVAEEYGLTIYDIRYLHQVSDIFNQYIYEKENTGSLRLVYSKAV